MTVEFIGTAHYLFFRAQQIIFDCFQCTKGAGVQFIITDEIIFKRASKVFNYILKSVEWAQESYCLNNEIQKSARHTRNALA